VRYIFEGKINNKIKALCDRLIRAIPELNYIKPEDFDVILAMEPPPKSHGQTTLADMNYTTHWLRDYVEYFLERKLPPYFLRIYAVSFLGLPVFAEPPRQSQISVLIHELHHISPTKRGVRPHTGFGDEVIFKIYKKNLKRLKRLG